MMLSFELISIYSLNMNDSLTDDADASSVGVYR